MGDETRLDLFRERMSGVASHRAPPGLVIEVGCASGFGLRAAFEQGRDAIGVEVSAFAADLARTRHGLSVLTGDPAGAGFQDESAHAVTMWDAIEHVVSPAGQRHRVRRILKPGGISGLSLPDAEYPGSFPASLCPPEGGLPSAHPPPEGTRRPL